MSDISTGYQDQSKNVSNAAGQGQNAINSFDPNAWKDQTSAGFNSLWGNQQGQQNDYLNQYKQTIAQNPSATQLYNQGNQQYNVPQLAQQANQLNNAVLTAPQNTLDSARGFNYDNSQVQNQTNLTLGRLSPLAQAATNQLQTAQGLASGYANAGMAQNAINLQPVQAQGQMLSDLWSRQATGFTDTAKAQLDGLVSKMQSGALLSQAEMQQYASLAQAEEAYQQQQTANQSAQATANITGNLANKYATLTPAQQLINTWTGKPYTYNG